MFTTFHSTSPRDHTKDAAPSSRPKRSQVRRACDWCKLMRTKCDSLRPCFSCQQAGRECVTNGQNHFRSVAAAAKEVERLRARVRELEGRVKQPPSPPAGGAHADRQQPVFYGLSSLPFFLKRMSAFLETALHQPELDTAAYAAAPAASPRGADYLHRAQEERFLDLFWQTHYFSYPIIHEADLRQAFRALWAGRAPDAARPPSPLVDIVLALCVQLGTSSMHHGRWAPPQEPGDSALAGFRYYQRCQTLIAETIEAPSITTVQCYVFSIVYLREAGLLNRAQVMTGGAIMMAVILGLNAEPQPTEPEPRKEMARRTWWSLYILDTQLAMDVGRPAVLDASRSSCRLPSDARDVARSLGAHYLFDDGAITWLGFQNQTLSLLNTIRAISAAFDAACATVDGFYRDGAAREKCARLLTEQMKELAAWVKQLPDGYRIPRRGGAAFSTDRSPLDLAHDVPIHWQRQRLLLELQYHHYMLSLCRPFICFTPSPDVSTPLSDTKAAAGLSHAITLTHMVHQALAASDVLAGINQVFCWQKNALFTMLGFAYAFPVSHPVAATRKAVDAAIAVVEMYRAILPEAARVAAAARGLADGAGAIVSGFRAASSPAPAAADGFASMASVADEPLGLLSLQNMAWDADWGDMDALWASLDQEEAGGAGPWMPLEDAFAVGESEGGVM